jgi:hypothetical protein
VLDATNLFVTTKAIDQIRTMWGPKVRKKRF